MGDGRTLAADGRGVAMVEFALALPVLVLLLFGMLGYGQYVLVAHVVQQIANDAARATVAGLSPDERRALAGESVAAALRAVPEVRADRLTAQTAEAPPHVVVTVRYDAGDLPLMRAGLVPMPPAVIERHAVVRQGGFP